MRPLHITLAGVGSLGDLHPLVGLGTALRQRGHRVTVLTNPEYAGVVGEAGLRHASAGSAIASEAAIASPNLWHPLKGLGVLWKHLLWPAVLPTFEYLEAYARGPGNLVIAAPFMFGARLAQERLRVPLLSAYTAPSLLRSCEAPLTIANWHVPSGMPRRAVQSIWRLLDRYGLEPMLRPPLDGAREQVGLPALGPDSVIGRWMHSPQGGVALFPRWFAAPRGDWPTVLHAAGFPLHDGGAGLDEQLDHFLGIGRPPVVFMPGSATRHAQPFFAAALQACCLRGLRAIFLTPYPEQVPGALPPNILHHAYAPFGALLPRCALLVHHGGIGSAAQAMRAGIPQITMPMAHDQFDNAWHLESLGLGLTLDRSRFTAYVLSRTLGQLLDNGAVAARCTAVARRLREEPALPALCEAIETAA